MEKTCPRCKNNFTCAPDDIFSCECTDIHIPPDLAFEIDLLYDDCVCPNCLKKMIEEFHQARNNKRLHHEK